MAAIIAGSGDGNASLIGLAPGARLVGVRIRNVVNILYSDALAGLNWVGEQAENYSIDIVSCSWGNAKSQWYYHENSTLNDILARTADTLVTDYGLVVVAATGNDGPGFLPMEPASGNYTIGVGAVHDPSAGGWALWNETPGKGSNGGYINYYDDDFPGNPDWYSPDVVAPGVSIKTADIGGSSDYKERLGTSVATAFVSGMIALYLEFRPDLANDTDGDGYPDIKQLLRASAVDVSGDTTDGIDYYYGAGRVDGVAGLDFLETDISSSKGDAVSFTATYTRNNEPMWLRDTGDWYKYPATSDVDFIITVTCDPDLMVNVTLWRGSTLEEQDASSGRGVDCYFTHTGYTGADYYVFVQVIGETSNPMGFPGDYYDITIDITSY